MIPEQEAGPWSLENKFANRELNICFIGEEEKEENIL